VGGAGRGSVRALRHLLRRRWEGDLGLYDADFRNGNRMGDVSERFEESRMSTVSQKASIEM